MRPYRKKPPGAPPNSATLLPTTRQVLEKYKNLLNIPVAMLIARAIDNELDSEVPFNYPCQIPTEPEFEEGAYFDEAKKIYDYLSDKGTPMDKEYLMLHRREMGITSREKFLLGLRELLNSPMVEEFRPKRGFFDYP